MMLRALSRMITLKLTPQSLRPALEQYWVLKLKGQDREAAALLKRAGEKGVPLPFDVP